MYYHSVFRKIKVFTYLSLLFFVHSNSAQNIELSISLQDSCINQRDLSTPIECVVTNKTEKGCWIDLEGFSIKVYQNNKLIKPNSQDVIGSFAIGDVKAYNHFVYLAKNSSVQLLYRTSVFFDYKLNDAEQYSLCVKYFGGRKKIFGSVATKELNSNRVSFNKCIDSSNKVDK